MANRLHILFLLLPLLFALSTGSARACGNGASAKCGRMGVEKPCCSSGQGHKKSASCAAGGTRHSGQKCPGKAAHGGCHCPCGLVAPGPVGAAIEECPPVLAPLSVSSTTTLRQAFYYARQLPEAVYPAIWQPPQLAA